MRCLKTEIHVVRRGENLSSIARRYGLSNWKALYNAPVNDHFRQLRPNPNHIRPGDRIHIPTDPKVVIPLLRARLNRLREVRKDAAALLDQIESDLRVRRDSLGGL